VHYHGSVAGNLCTGGICSNDLVERGCHWVDRERAVEVDWSAARACEDYGHCVLRSPGQE
jgi:hypothetical protein